MLTEKVMRRTEKLKEELLSCEYEICLERMRFFTEIYKSNKQEPEIIKRAQSIAHTLRNMTIFIRDDELLVGNETSKNLGEKINLDLMRFNIGLDSKNKLKKIRKRKVQSFNITDEEMDELLELVSYWKGKSLVGDHINKRLLEDDLIPKTGKLASLVPNISIQVGTTEGHLSAGYKKILELGYGGILKEAQKLQKKLDKDDPEYKEKYNFYEAIKIYYEAAIDFLKRYSESALQKSQTERDEARKNELIQISEMLDKFTKTVPETFFEAIQLIHFTQNIANIIYQRSVLALGRLDQILWSYYKRDLKEGRITPQFALELIEELNLKLTWNLTLLPTDFTMIANAFGQNTQTITIGGINPQTGEDAVNDLSYMFLDAYKNLKVFTTDLSVRIHKNTSEKFLHEAIEVFKETSGIAFYNDNVIIPGLKKSGYTLEDARNYVLIGCVEPTGQGNSFAATGRMFMNLPGILELTLNNGYSNFSRQTDGLQSGEPKKFITFEDLYEAFKNQLSYNVKKSVDIAQAADEEAMKYFQHPFTSAMIEDCLETGKDYVCGGAKYNFSSITAYGFATLVDSFYAIKKAVYEDNLVSLPELIKVLNSNFSGQEELRLKLKNKYPKWGNDIEEIDQFANELWDLFCNEVCKHSPLRGGRYSAGAYSMGIHVMEGFFTQPTADGRKAMQPISNSLSPVNGVEKNGLTAIFNSLSKLDYSLGMNGVAFNIRVHPQNFDSEENIEKFSYLLRGYFESGGMQIQPNVVSTETLRDAQKHPENYGDLIVKVGGYNATFTDLGSPIQNDIIDRIENGL